MTIQRSVSCGGLPLITAVCTVIVQNAASSLISLAGSQFIFSAAFFATMEERGYLFQMRTVWSLA